MRKAFVTGIGGQDGYYLSLLLLKEGYRVVGLTHRSGSSSDIKRRLPDIELVEGDVTDRHLISSLIRSIEPDEVYNLAGFSFPPASINAPLESFHVNAQGALNVLEGVREFSLANPRVKFYQASTSEMFGRSRPPPYDEDTPFRPETPYAASKVAAHHLVTTYREHYGMFAVAGILFNHESPLRPPHYVTRKIAQGAARISLGQAHKIVLGDLHAVRDWGFARDYVEGMWLMMQQDAPEDFVLATGIPHSVQDLVATALGVVGIDDWQEHVEVSPSLVRPPEAHPPIGCPEKARIKLGWKAGTAFEELVQKMVVWDLALLE